MKKFSICLAAFLFATAIAHYLFSEAAVYYEMRAIGVNHRKELADDFGLGLLWLFFVIPGSLVFGIISSWVTWIILRGPKH